MTPCCFKRLPPLLIVLACLAAGPVHAARTNPAGREADLIYNSDYHTYQFCNGSSWIPFGGIGVASTRRSIVSGWPDAIVCDVAGWGPEVFFESLMPYSGNYYYLSIYSGSGILFNRDGSYNYASIGPSNCDNLSISTLYSNGQAFNMVVGP